MCGTEVMNGRDVAVFLHFPPGELSQAVHKEQLLALLDAWDQNTLSDFLKFTTGLCVLPIGGLKNPDVSLNQNLLTTSTGFESFLVSACLGCLLLTCVWSSLWCALSSD